MKMLLVFLMLLFVNISAQLEFYIYTDKESYEYGEPISITCGLANNTDTTIGILFSNFSTCQASFEFNGYRSWEWATCLPTTQEVNIPAKHSREYNWVLHPQIFGLPNSDGQHKIVCNISYRSPPNPSSELFTHTDTIYIEAPMFLGGQLNVVYIETNDSLVLILKDSLNIEVIERNLRHNNNIYEIWQVLNVEIDSIYKDLKENVLLSFVGYNRGFEYNSINLVTSINEPKPSEISYYLSNAFPNPFNPTTKIEYHIPTSSEVKIVLYDILGNEVKTLVNNFKKAGRYEVIIDGNNLTSGIYIYRMINKNYSISKKVVLIK